MILEHRHTPKKKIALILVAVALTLAATGGAAYYFLVLRKTTASSYAECVAAGNPVMQISPAVCQTPDGKKFTNPNASVAIEGTAVCLPHKGDGPQTTECAVGLKSTDGTYYGISGDTSGNLASAAGSDRKVKVSGMLEPSTNDIYDITQLIAVKNVEFIE